MLQQPVQALECPVCEQLISPKDVHVHVGNLLLLLARLKEERFSLCPSCTREVPTELQGDEEYQARWTPFVRQMIRAHNRGAKWHTFKPKQK